MGNCFGKKKNKVGPEPQGRRGDISAVISTGTPFQQPSTSAQMVAVLDKDQDARVKKGGVAFAVTLDRQPSNTTAPPRRLPPLPPRTLGGAHQPKSSKCQHVGHTEKGSMQKILKPKCKDDKPEGTMSYSLAEKELMTAIMRDDFLNERKVKARRLQNRTLPEDAVTSESNDETLACAADDGEIRITYTGEEDQLMAEVLRDDFLSERRAKARKCQGRGAAQDKGNSG